MSLSRTGALMFALALAFLSVAAGREILRPARASLAAAAALAIPPLAAWALAPRWLPPLALIAAAWAVLAHAMFAAVRRLEPVRRLRVFFLATLILGAAGAAAAVVRASAARSEPEASEGRQGGLAPPLTGSGSVGVDGR